jgi:nitrogen fixation/metabolism regulation signal transduction histidine kinase
VQPILALEVAERVEARFSDGPPVAVTVIGGKRLGPGWLAALHHEASLLAPDGTVLVGRADRPALQRRWPRRLVELRAEGPQSPILARLEIVVPDDELAHTLALLGWASAAMGLGALALALGLGFFMARRMTRPLDELASGAQAVARGRLDVQVGVGRKDEIGELAESFNAMTRDLTTAREELVRAERVAAWREIAQRIAHEIKNPLTPIQMAIETLQRARDKDARLFNELFAESSKTILDEVSRLKAIVAEFSRFARLPAPRLAAVDVTELVEATLALYAGGSAVQKSLEPRLRALADRDQLVQVLLNLLENARDAVAASPEPSIRVTTRAAGELVELEVADSGPGLSDEVRAKLFTPYFTTKPKGTGLGLAIVHRIVSDHGGEIRVDGSEAGAVFVVALRRAPVEESRPPAAA